MPDQVPQSDQFLPGGPLSYAERTRPPAVSRAVMAMYIGAVLSVVGTVWSVHEADASNVGLVGGFGIFGGAIDLGLWVWMALANRAGHNWARITGTVFFGISTLSTVLSVVVYALVSGSDGVGGDTMTSVGTGSIALACVTWLVGLFATVMMWNKSAAPFYQPQAQYGPMGWAVPGAAPYGYPAVYQYPGSYPAQYPYPYPYPGPYPGPAPSGPVQLGAQPTDQPPGPAAQPADPWQTPED